MLFVYAKFNFYLNMKNKNVVFLGKFSIISQHTSGDIVIEFKKEVCITGVSGNGCWAITGLCH